MWGKISLQRRPQNRPQSSSLMNLNWLSRWSFFSLNLFVWIVTSFHVAAFHPSGFMTLKSWPLQRTWVIPAHRRHKKSEVILGAGIDMARGCLMDKQKYRPAFYRLNQEGFIRWAKSQDNIVNRDIWRKTGRARREITRRYNLPHIWGFNLFH